jgi:hypothetical protein
MTTLVSPQEFVGTYDPDTDIEPWELLQQYYRATKTSAELRGGNGGRAGSSRVASHLELPRERLRTWVDEGGKPDPQHGLERAQAKGWVDVDTDSTTFDGLNRLVAQVFAGGSITTETYRPCFAIPNDDVRDRISEACRLVGVDYDIVHADDEGRATELRITEDGSILGRVFSVLGASVGEKATNESITLPGYLNSVSEWHRLDFARIYVFNRAVEFEGKDTMMIREQRPKDYSDELAGFLEETLGESVTYGEEIITISADAARTLR